MFYVPLSETGVRLWVGKLPGVYCLVDANNNVIYVGRSDTDLASRLRDHFPDRETNSEIRQRFPVGAHVEYASVTMPAYQLESEWCRVYQPVCNKIAPAVPASRYGGLGLASLLANPPAKSQYRSERLSLLEAVQNGSGLKQEQPRNSYGSGLWKFFDDH